jgi:hypothetical protein
LARWALSHGHTTALSACVNAAIPLYAGNMVRCPRALRLSRICTRGSASFKAPDMRLSFSCSPLVASQVLYCHRSGDCAYHDNGHVAAHFHYVMSLAPCSGIFAGIYLTCRNVRSQNPRMGRTSAL